MLRPEVKLERGTKAYYGIEAQDKLIDGFTDLYNDKFVLDYRFIHLIVEHKHLLYKKLCFLAYSLGIDEKAEKLLLGFKQLCKQYENIRYIYMSNVMKESPRNSIYDQLFNKKIIKDLQNRLRKASFNEKKILKDFLCLTKKVL